jgi:hypothetical protein
MHAYIHTYIQWDITYQLDMIFGSENVGKNLNVISLASFSLMKSHMGKFTTMHMSVSFLCSSEWD